MIRAEGPQKLPWDTFFFLTHLWFLRLMVIHRLALTLMTISKKLDQKRHTSPVSGGGELCVTGGIVGGTESWTGISSSPQSCPWWGTRDFDLSGEGKLQLAWQPQSLMYGLPSPTWTVLNFVLPCKHAITGLSLDMLWCNLTPGETEHYSWFTFSR